MRDLLSDINIYACTAN